ncbi:hypothetical protein VP01_1250g11 [Puccinia sorghi]|uniref:F-type H+-transporting ATPase subunit J n=1 Tax=Puccinia sorghi TaxID=27349 RepID=A0A0L6VPF7_9BASI|nr:hypothetical protein VP01_1250g11 [Puccinia sorghi]
MDDSHSLQTLPEPTFDRKLQDDLRYHLPPTAFFLKKKKQATMSFFGVRAWPTPVFKPMSHFIVGGAITFYLVNKMQNAMLKSPVYAKDPRNPHGNVSSSFRPYFN